MPRRQVRFEERPRTSNAEFAQSLAAELRSNNESGQPIIEEQEFPTGQIRVTVIWDDWDRLSMEDRTAAILRAYELAEGRQYRDRIGLASGLTVPEAHAAGMLQFQIIPALRRDDPVSLEQCRQTMIDEGASILFGPDQLQLRFASREEAETARSRLIQRLPNSDQVWVISQDVGRVAEWAER